MKIKKHAWVIALLAVLLVLALGFIAYNQIEEYNKERLLEAYQYGVQTGYEEAVKQLMNQLVSCQPVPVYAGNVTLNAIAVECLQKE